MCISWWRGDMFVCCICFAIVCVYRVQSNLCSGSQGEGGVEADSHAMPCQSLHSVHPKHQTTNLSWHRHIRYTDISLYYWFQEIHIFIIFLLLQIYRNDDQNILTWDLVSFLGALCTEWTRIWVTSFPIIWRQVLLFFLNMNQKFSKWNLCKLKCCQQSANLFWFMSMKICVWYSSALGRSEEKI